MVQTNKRDADVWLLKLAFKEAAVGYMVDEKLKVFPSPLPMMWKMEGEDVSYARHKT